MAGKRSSEFVMKIVFFLFLFCNCSKIINAKTYQVGDEVGWSPEVYMLKWPDGKTFYAGDVLEFKYPTGETPDQENVIVTDEAGFLSCSLNDNSTTYDSGDDKIPLPYGQNYFMGGIAEDCQGGLKMAIFAHTPPPPSF